MSSILKRLQAIFTRIHLEETHSGIPGWMMTILPFTCLTSAGMFMLRTKNSVIGGMPNVAYKKGIQKVNNPSCLYIFSDGVYEIPRTDGSMCQFKEFSEFVQQPKKERQSDIERIFQYAKKINQFDSFEDDFTILEIVFTDTGKSV